MSFAPRTLDAISQAVRGAFRQYMPGTDASLRQNVTYVIAKVVTLVAREYELRLEWLYRQLFLRTATVPSIVRMHAADVGVLQKPASPAAGWISGAGSPSATWPSGVRFYSGGATYVTTAAFTANALGVYTAPVRAEASGSATNRDVGAGLMLEDPALWPTLDQEAAVSAGGLGGGADVETIEELRARALRRKATPPQGGALADYETWALDVSGVVRAWAANFASGVGSVGIWILFAGRANGIPTAADLAAVDAHVAELRLVRGAVFAVASVPAPVDVTIHLTPDSAALRAAVTAALAAFLDARDARSRIRPGLPDAPFTVSRAWLSEVISVTAGEDSHVLVEPSSDLVFQPGELPVPGVIAFV